MAKYDWKQLEKEYILSDCKSVSSFLKNKGIKSTSYTRSNTKGWKEKKRQKTDKKVTRTIDKVIEKESEKEAQQIVDIKSIANDLALNIIKSNTELHIHMDMFGGEHNGIIDAGRLKKLTSALKDISYVLNEQKGDSKEDKIDQYLSKLEEKFKND